MKYVKVLGMLAVAAATLTSFAGSASATITSPAGTAYTGNIHMTATNVWFHTGGQVSCGDATLVGSITSGATKVPITELKFSECGTSTFSVLQKGTMTIASDGTVTLSGTEYTKMVHATVLGFPVTTHCLLEFNNTVIGKLTEGVSPAQLNTNMYEVPNKPTDGACSNAILTGTYTVTKPGGAITID